MKFRTTQKEIKSNYAYVLSVGYCNLQHALVFTDAMAYTTRREGWACDVYDIGGGVAVATGYAPFGNVPVSYEIAKKYDDMARDVISSFGIYSIEEKRELLNKIIKDFRLAVVGV